MQPQKLSSVVVGMRLPQAQCRCLAGAKDHYSQAAGICRERGRSGGSSGGLGGGGGAGETELQLQRRRLRSRIKVLKRQLEDVSCPGTAVTAQGVDGTGVAEPPWKGWPILCCTPSAVRL